MKKLAPLLTKLFLCGLLTGLYSCESSIYELTPNMVVIIKADDLENMTSNWERFIDVVETNTICAGIGVISSHVTDSTSIQRIRHLALLKQRGGDAIIEFWNHGYDHSGDNNQTEFWGTSVEDQIKHIQKSQQFFTDSLGIKCVTFSTPFNRTSAETYQALSYFPEIKILMTARKTEIYEPYKWVEIRGKEETLQSPYIRLNILFLSVKNVPLTQIKQHIHSVAPNGCVVVQIHPNLWDNKDFTDFQKMIDLFKRKHVQFMTPQQYYAYLNH